MTAEDARAGAGAANAALLARFYAALGARDAQAMAACYHRDATFSDPVFPALDRDGVAAMWRMLCARGRDLRVAASRIEADAAAGRAHWDATYTYAPTRRPVENRVDATFAFRDGLIVRHDDRFDLARWMRQALGAKGLLLGWLPPARRAVQATAARALADWRANERGQGG
jgi:ketosteroid isomerase-like protein